MKFDNCFNEYLEFVSVYRKKGTYLFYKKMFKSLLSVLKILKIDDTDKINDQTFNKIIKYYLDNTTKKNSQINSVMASLVTVLNYFDIKHPKKIKLRDDTKSYTALSKNELDELLRYLKNMDLDYLNNLTWSLAVYLLLETGVRISELLSMRFKNVDFDNRVIYLDSTKNGYNRYVFYGDMSDKYLNMMFLKGFDYVLWNFNTSKPMDKNSMYHFFDRLNADIGFRQNIHAHRLRKTFATGLLHNGCNLAVISKLLGHRDIKQTMIYLQMDNTLLSDEYNKFYPY